MNYVCGFMMSYDLMQFLLIRKTHPDWQKGKLNGIGGKIETVPDKTYPIDPMSSSRTETPFEAMIREFHEETGITTTRNRWRCFHIEEFYDASEGTTNKVYFFAAFGDEAKRQYIGANNDPLFEVVSSYTLVDLFFTNPEQTIYNIPYLIKMIIDNIRSKNFKLLNPEGVNSIP